MKLALPGAMVALALFSAGIVDAQVSRDAIEAPPVDAAEDATESAPPSADAVTPTERTPAADVDAQGRTEAEADAQANPDRARGQAEAEGRIRGEAGSDAETGEDARTRARGEINLGAGVEADADRGLRIRSVEQTGLAADAGLREGDVIMSVDGQEFSSQSELNAFLRQRGDARIPITVMRDGREQEMFLNAQAQAQARTGAAAAAGNRAALGVSLRPAADGIGIIRVRPGSPAAQAGLRAGDRIVSLNGESFTSVEPFVDTLGRTRLNNDAELVYLRNGQQFQTTFRPAPWGDVYADAGGGLESRQTLRPDLAPSPPAPSGGTGYGYAPAPTYDNRGYYNTGNPCQTSRFYTGRRGYYYGGDDDDWEDRYDD